MVNGQDATGRDLVSAVIFPAFSPCYATCSVFLYSHIVHAMTSLFPLPSPILPEFTTLLVAGPLHASAPIHLCLSHLANRPDTTAVLISPSRQSFLNSLLDLNDDWINECGGFGAVSSLLAKVTSLCVLCGTGTRPPSNK